MPPTSVNKIKLTIIIFKNKLIDRLGSVIANGICVNNSEINNGKIEVYFLNIFVGIGYLINGFLLLTEPVIFTISDGFTKT